MNEKLLTILENKQIQLKYFEIKEIFEHIRYKGTNGQ